MSPDATTANTTGSPSPPTQNSPLLGSNATMNKPTPSAGAKTVTTSLTPPTQSSDPVPAGGKNLGGLPSTSGSGDMAGITLEDYKGKTISEILRDKGKIETDQYEQLKFEVAQKSGSEEDLIRDKGWVDEDEITRAKAASYGIPFVNLNEVEIGRELIARFPYEVAKSHKAILFKEDPKLAHVGMVDPLDIQRVNFIENTLKKNVKAYFASGDDIKSILDTKYAGRMESEVTEAVEEVAEGVVEITEGIQDISEVADSIASAPVARIVNMILEYAVKFKASDIHIEPREKKVGVRFRIHGVMMERLQLPVKLVSSVVSRVKILSDLKIDEHRVPQDGRFQIKVGPKEIDLRVSIMPTVYGEKIVIRLLEKGKGMLKLEKTGLRGFGYKVYREAIASTQGIILITGPTGSGKTQTLASSLAIRNTPDVNIVTLEDPVEIKVDGVNQVQINADVGLTFAAGLRAILRQDPDIIEVGEIRDQETAELAIQASLTGHLVFSTLHTNSAAGALPRLLDMEIEPFLIASTVNVIVAQRLVRTICDNCKEAYQASEEIVRTIHKVLSGLKGFDMYSYPKRDNKLAAPGQVSTVDASKIPPAELAKQQAQQPKQGVTLYRGKGCSKCNESGYSGRIGIFEVLKVTEKISQLIMEHRTAGNLEQQAIADGMITMVQDGFMKALEGITTVEEVLRVRKN